MDWERRSRVFLIGAPLALIPAVAFLPLFVFVFLRSSSAGEAGRTSALAALQFAPLVFLEVLGSILVGFAGLRSRLSYVTFLAGATAVLLFVVSGYTGMFFAIYAGWARPLP